MVAAETTIAVLLEGEVEVVVVVEPLSDTTVNLTLRVLMQDLTKKY